MSSAARGGGDSPAGRQTAQRRESQIPKITTVPPEFTDEAGGAFLQRRGEGYSFDIAELETDRGIGAIGLWLQKTDAGRASTGYWIAPSARGRRSAEEALRAVGRWAIATLKLARVELYVEPWNEASIRTAERAAFEQEGLMRSWQPVGDERPDMYTYAAVGTDVLDVADTELE